MGFEAIVPIARWKGYGAETDARGSSFDTLAWAAAIGEATEPALEPGMERFEAEVMPLLEARGLRARGQPSRRRR